ncbi:hypothetical protein GCM10010517_67220 [Streptosporangium fragile]|uniref:Uncharacterized protein n=1 Tax=Streptosporangium fragile TaxID=46186 RepID=A0ABN3W7A7_9ACTN
MFSPLSGSHPPPFPDCPLRRVRGRPGAEPLVPAPRDGGDRGGPAKERTGGRRRPGKHYDHLFCHTIRANKEAPWEDA